MNDRELLEMAANAAGLNVEWKEYSNAPSTMVVRYENPIDGVTGYQWNPLTDDGDALRLAVKLHLHVSIQGDMPGDEMRTSVAHASFGSVCEWSNGDEGRATRIAIVRAAAEIGRSMP